MSEVIRDMSVFPPKTSLLRKIGEYFPEKCGMSSWQDWYVLEAVTSGRITIVLRLIADHDGVRASQRIMVYAITCDEFLQVRQAPPNSFVLDNLPFMSIPAELRASARSTYRLLFRTAANTFRGEHSSFSHDARSKLTLLRR